MAMQGSPSSYPCEALANHMLPILLLLECGPDGGVGVSDLSLLEVLGTLSPHSIFLCLDMGELVLCQELLLRYPCHNS